MPLIYCIYVSVTKPTCTVFVASLNTGSALSLKVTGKAITPCSMALPSKLCAALHGRSFVGSMRDCRHAEVWICQFGWECHQELTATMVQVPEDTAVSTQGQHYVQ